MLPLRLSQEAIELLGEITMNLYYLSSVFLCDFRNSIHESVPPVNLYSLYALLIVAQVCFILFFQFSENFFPVFVPALPFAASENFFLISGEYTLPLAALPIFL